MKILSVLFLTGLTILTMAPSAGRAQGIPVFDASSFTQMITQLEQMAKEYAKQLEQLDEAIKQTQALTGPRAMGSLENSALDRQLRRYLPDDWLSTLSMDATAGPAGQIYSDLYAFYQPIARADYLPAQPDSPAALAMERRTQTTLAAMSAAQSAYNNVTARFETYETLLGELDATQDLKASIDLQARIAAENGMILSELIRMQSLILQQNAAQDSQALTQQSRASMANRYDPQIAAQSFQADIP